jgi:hypothetical protein
MKTLKLSLVAASLVVAFMLIFSACTKTGIDASAGGKVAVYLTDGPGEFDSVFIDIQKVEVKIDTNSAYKDKDDRCDDDDDKEREVFGVGREDRHTCKYRREFFRDVRAADSTGENADEGDAHLHG